jgi:hypothetical protein
LILLFGSFLLLFGLIALQRRLRSRAAETFADSVREELSPHPSTKSKFPRFRKVSTQQDADEIDAELEGWLNSIKERAEIGRATAQAAPIRKSSRPMNKVGVAKKSIIKKATPKKRAIKKIATPKKANERVATRK